MTDPMLTNEMKRHTVIVLLKADHGDLEIARFLRVARFFVHKIRKELEKENDYVMSVSKRKKHFTRSNSMRTPKFIHKVEQTIDENRGQSMRSIAKKLHVSEKEYSGRHSIQIEHDEERSIYVWNKKQTRLNRSKRLLNKFKNPAETRIGGR